MDFFCVQWFEVRDDFSFFILAGFLTRLTWRVSLVEQELFTLPEHLSSPPVFSGVRFGRSFVFCVLLDRCLSVFLFVSVIVFSVFLRFPDSYYPVGISKLFLVTISGSTSIHKIDTATPWVPLVEQKLLTLPDHTSSPPVYRVTLWYLHNFRTINNPIKGRMNVTN